MFRLPFCKERIRGLVGLAFILVFGPGAPRAATTPPAKGPNHQDTNVIMISVDTLRHDHLGCYGYGRNTSEHIDRLAQRSVVFDNYISQAVLTPVSQMSIFTSQYPRVNGVVSFQPAVDWMRSKTLSEILKAYGYTNAAFLSSPEFMDSRYGDPEDETSPAPKLFSRGFDVYEYPTGPFRDVPEPALEWLRTHRDGKFFLWLPIGTVHWPYSHSARDPYRTRFDPTDYHPFFLDFLKFHKGRKSLDAIHADVLSYLYDGWFYGDSARPYALTEADKQYIVGRYDAGIAYTDAFIGRLLSLLVSLGIDRKTLIVLYSTHGEDLGEHGFIGHYDLYDTETKNALLLRFPEDQFGGTRFAPQAQGIDIVPTVLDFLGIPIHHGAQGVSLLREISGERPARGTEFAFTTRTPIFEYVLFKGRRLFAVSTRKTEVLSSYMQLLEQNLGEFDPQSPPYDIAVRTEDWKLIVRNDAPLHERVSWWRFVSGKKVEVPALALYDLRNDPLEQTNVAEQHSGVVASLKQRLEEWDAVVRARAAATAGKTRRLRIPYP